MERKPYYAIVNVTMENDVECIFENFDDHYPYIGALITELERNSEEGTVYIVASNIKDGFAQYVVRECDYFITFQVRRIYLMQ